MADPALPRPAADDDLRRRLQDLGQLLAQADHLEPEMQQQLAELVQELGQAMQGGELEPSAVAQLSDSTAQLTDALRAQHQGLLSTARDGLERLVVDAEGRAPVATGFAERLIDVLSNLGI